MDNDIIEGGLPRSILDRAAVHICSQIGSVLQKLVEEIAARRQHFDPIESSGQRPYGRSPIKVYNFGQLLSLQSPAPRCR